MFWELSSELPLFTCKIDTLLLFGISIITLRLTFLSLLKETWPTAISPVFYSDILVFVPGGLCTKSVLTFRLLAGVYITVISFFLLPDRGRWDDAMSFNFARVTHPQWSWLWLVAHNQLTTLPVFPPMMVLSPAVGGRHEQKIVCRRETRYLLSRHTLWGLHLNMTRMAFDHQRSMQIGR